MIEFRYPKCDEKMNVPDSGAVESVACPVCENVVAAPWLAVDSDGKDSQPWSAGTFLYQVVGWVMAVVGLAGVGVAGTVEFILIFVCGVLMIGQGGLARRLDDLRQDRRDAKGRRPS